MLEGGVPRFAQCYTYVYVDVLPSVLPTHEVGRVPRGRCARGVYCSVYGLEWVGGRAGVGIGGGGGWY